MIIPNDVVRHVGGAIAGEARVAANRVLCPGAKPLVVIIANDVAIIDFTNAFKKAIERAKDEGDTDSVRAWKELVLRILAAYDGAKDLPT